MEKGIRDGDDNGRGSGEHRGKARRISSGQSCEHCERVRSNSGKKVTQVAHAWHQRKGALPLIKACLALQHRQHGGTQHGERQRLGDRHHI